VKYKANIGTQTDKLKILFLMKWNNYQKCERPNKTRGNKP